MNANVMPLSLYGETFHALKDDFDSVMNRTVGNMEMKGASEATVTIKVKVSLEKTTARDLLANGYDGLRDVITPKFEHKIDSVMQVKDKKAGCSDEGYELVWDQDKKRYILREVDDGQVVMDGYEDASDSETVKALPSAAKDEDAKFVEWVAGFVGDPLTVYERDGIFTLRTEDNNVLLSSGCSEDSPSYCPAETLAPHVGHELYVADNGEELQIICDTCQKVIINLAGEPEGEYDVPDSGDDEAQEAKDDDSDEASGVQDYEYDDPEDVEDEEG